MGNLTDYQIINKLFTAKKTRYDVLIWDTLIHNFITELAVYTLATARITL